MKELFARLAKAAQSASLRSGPSAGGVAYVANHSYPYSSNGYAVRTHGIASGLVRLGLAVNVLNRPGHPWDLRGNSLEHCETPYEHDGVRYLFFRRPSSQGVSFKKYLAEAIDIFKEAFAVLSPGMVMAASDWENALPAAIAALESGFPFCYEVRGFWEISRISREPGWQKSQDFKAVVFRETAVAQAAHRVFTLNRFMRDELIRRGVTGSKIHLVPNAYGELPDLATAQKLRRGDLGLGSGFLAGYIGSFSPYEGLEDLVRACAMARADGLDISLMLVGSSNPLGLTDSNELCPVSENLLEIARETCFSNHLRLTGRVAPEALADYYRMLDLVVIPRKPLPVSELVSPLKPLEAMAYARPLLQSDVAPMAEVALESGTATYDKSDIRDLAQKLKDLAQDPDSLRRMGTRARAWVEEHRQVWNVVAPMREAHDALCKEGATTAESPSSPGTPVLSAAKTSGARRPKVALILDEFSLECFGMECDYLQLRPQEWLRQLTSFEPDFVFVESAWRGVDGLWQRKVSNARRELTDMTSWCRSKGIPTVFWSKEDPVYYSTFLRAARHFDHVCTTDVDCIARYKKDLGHDRVHLLPFSVQPRTHNPVEYYARKDACNFAGAYYLRYPERQRDFASLIAAMREFKPCSIYDRNHGNPLPEYRFPEEYRPLILGGLDYADIERAYKGFRFGMNMNTIKQSQTMFARRVYELLASNTVVVGNYSRGARLLFGETIIASDNAGEVKRRLEDICRSENLFRRFRLLGLRKVLSEHTSAHRVEYILARLGKTEYTRPLPLVIALSVVAGNAERDRVLQSFARQKYAAKKLFIVENRAGADARDTGGIRFFPTIEDCLDALDSTPSGVFAGFLHPDDHYGTHYFTDLLLGTRFSRAMALGKAAFHRAVDGEPFLENDGEQYAHAAGLSFRACVFKIGSLGRTNLESMLRHRADAEVSLPDMLALDEFHYCRDGARLAPELVESVVGDLPLVNQGISLQHGLLPFAESIQAKDAPREDTGESLPRLSARDAHQLLSLADAGEGVKAVMAGERLVISSRLSAENQEILLLRGAFSRDELNLKHNNQVRLVADISPGCEFRVLFDFLDSGKRKLSRAMTTGAGVSTLVIPQECEFLRLGFRLQGSGEVRLDKLIFGIVARKPHAVVCNAPTLVLTKQYPDYHDLYRYGFLHSRVRAYRECGLPVEVFRLTQGNDAPFREFEGVDVTSGNAMLLDATLGRGQCSHLLIHLLDPRMWEVVKKHLDSIRVTVWVHGADIQLWQRRAYDLEGLPEADVARVKSYSDQRAAFWRSLLAKPHPNLHFVFVSHYLADEALADLGVELDPTRYSVIHNNIDTNLFSQPPKTAEQRGRILSIRPYSGRAYANDLTVQAILELSRRPVFQHLSFGLYGDGELFDSLLEPLRIFPNVAINKGFLRQNEIARLHGEYGVFLTPSRMDTQGVSRDEAMSSGLVPVCTRVGAVPEFVDDSCGLVVPPEDPVALADAVEYLYSNPESYLALSKGAVKRVRSQSGFKETIGRELALIQR